MADVPHQRIALHNRPDVLSLHGKGCRPSEHFRNPTFGQVRGCRNEECPLRKGGQVLVGLDTGQVVHSVWLLSTQQLEHPGVSPNEVLILNAHNAMRMVGRFDRVDPNDVDRALRKAVDGCTEHKRCVHRVEFPQVVGQIHDVGLRHALERCCL